MIASQRTGSAAGADGAGPKNGRQRLDRETFAKIRQHELSHGICPAN